MTSKQSLPSFYARTSTYSLAAYLNQKVEHNLPYSRQIFQPWFCDGLVTGFNQKNVAEVTF